MKEACLAHEVVQHLPELEALALIAVGALGMALTQRQKEAVDERDHRECLARQAGIPHECDDPQGIERHHILSQRYAKTVGFDPDVPENIATLCRTFHREYIHPDTKQAFDEYPDYKNGTAPNPFKKMMDERNEKLKQRKIYWNSIWDRVLQAQAQKNTTKARRRGWRWPLSRKQQQEYGREEL